MPLPIIRYALDPTGTNSDNRVIGEIHTLTTRTIRAAAPLYGAYFTETLSVYDESTTRLLVRNVDYQCAELLQEATLRYGKEICLVVLIINPDVSNEIRLSYQVLGGDFQNNASGIITLYETAIQDNRPVDWINVLNRPLEYPPTLHNHFLSQVVGFEPLIGALERIRNAIVLGDVPAYEALIDWVDSQLALSRAHMVNYENPHHVTFEQLGADILTYEEALAEIPNSHLVPYDILLLILADRCFRGCYSLTPSRIELTEGQSLTVAIQSTNVLNNLTHYWTIENIGTNNADFVTMAGLVTIANNVGSFTISSRTDVIIEEDETFRLHLRTESPSGKIVASTGILSLKNRAPVTPSDFDWFTFLSSDGCLLSPPLTLGPQTLFFNQSL